jgi:RNA polymerase sigma factor (sigma-70 family)
MTHTDVVFSETFESGFARTAAFLRSRGISSHEAEELAQGAWVKGWESRAQLDDPQCLLPWVNTIALNLLRSNYRSARNRKEVGVGDFPLTSECFETKVAACLDLEGLMGSVKQRERDLLERCYIEGHTTREASRECKVTSMAVRLRLFRAVATMRQVVKRSKKVLPVAVEQQPQAA